MDPVDRQPSTDDWRERLAELRRRFDGPHSETPSSAPDSDHADASQRGTTTLAAVETTAQTRDQGSGPAASGTPASGTPASGTPASGTPASGTPASGTQTGQQPSSSIGVPSVVVAPSEPPPAPAKHSSTARRAAIAGFATLLGAAGIAVGWRIWSPGPTVSLGASVVAPAAIAPTSVADTTVAVSASPATTVVVTTLAPPTAPSTLLPTTTVELTTTLAQADRDPETVATTTLPVVGEDGKLTLPTNYALYEDGILYLVGAVESQEVADGIMERALAVLPPDRISGSQSVEAGAGGASGVVYVPEGVLFDSGSTVIKPDFFDDVDLAAALLSLYPNVTLTVVGHTDNVGSDEYNLELSRQRAQAVVEYISAKGISPDRLEPIGRGETSPVDTNDTPEGRQRNRRIEVIFNDLLS